MLDVTLTYQVGISNEHGLARYIITAGPAQFLSAGAEFALWASGAIIRDTGGVREMNQDECPGTEESDSLYCRFYRDYSRLDRDGSCREVFSGVVGALDS